MHHSISPTLTGGPALPLAVGGRRHTPLPTLAAPQRTGDRAISLAEEQRLVSEHLPFARFLGRSFSPCASLVDDCEQVASMGLVLAVRRWDPERGESLRAYARPTILGELRRFLRDTTWWIRPPRRLQELCLELRHTEEDLRHRLGTQPSSADLARELGVEPAELHEVRWAAQGRQVGSVDGLEEALAPTVTGAADAHDEWLSVLPAIRALDPLDRSVLLRRYLADETQQEIADVLGISQAQVSRRLRRAVSAVREHVQVRAA